MAFGKEDTQTLRSMGMVGIAKVLGDKYEEAEAMNRQTPARYEKVQETEHPDTLLSVHCLAHCFANRHCYHDSLVLYDRACTVYSIVLGEDHPTTHACH